MGLAGDFLDSNFVTTLLGAAAGAWAGAHFAQRITERAARRTRLQDEVRNTNAAIGLAHFIGNAALSLKAQHVRDLAQNYRRLRQDFNEFADRQRRGLNPPGAEFHVPMELDTLEQLVLPIERLQLLASEKLNLAPRPSTAVSTVAATAHSLNVTIGERNSCLDDFRTTGPHTQGERVRWFFALPDNEGTVDGRYAAFMENIPAQLDSVIFFSELLIEDLITHGERHRAALKKKFRINAQRITRPNFADAEARGLMPRTEDFSDWLSMFVLMPPEPERGWRRWWEIAALTGRRAMRKSRRACCWFIRPFF
jgi:hypothetical protein